MSVQYRVADQVLTVNDATEKTLGIVHKYDAFLNLLCAGKYAFQKDAVRAALTFLVSEKYPNTELLAVENFNAKAKIQQLHDNKEAFLGRLPLRDRKAVCLDLATGTGKSYVLYALAAIALAEGLVDRVLVLCPSLTIEDGLRRKFDGFIGNRELTAIMRELGAVIATPGLKTGNKTTENGDICVENVHAVYERTGTSIYDSFHGKGGRTLVLNDEAHHIFSKADQATKKWLEFLQNPDYGFLYIVGMTGTAYIGNDYFPDVVYRYGLKKAIEDGVVKKPNYKETETLTRKGYQETYAIHLKNREEYGAQLKPISIVVTESIAGCVEVWNELVDFLAKKEGGGREAAEKKCIWVTSGIPSGKDGERVKAIVDKPEQRRQKNLELLKKVDDPANPVEWIVSVSMLTEGWDVKNVFLIVPHEKRAFESKLLIAQVLGRGLRVPPGLTKQPLVTINNHEGWSEEIHNLLREILEIENQLGWGYDPDRSKYVFPLHNLCYEPQQTTVQTTKKAAREPDMTFKPQDRRTKETSVFSETGTLTTDIEHADIVSIAAAVKEMKLFLAEKDADLAKKWSTRRIREFVVTRLKQGGYPSDFLSKENLSILQQSFGPMFRRTNEEYPRISQRPDCVVPVDLTQIAHQTFSENTLRESGTVYYAGDADKGFRPEERNLWQQYLKFKSVASQVGEDGLSDDAKAIGHKLVQVDDPSKLKTPWNILYSSHAPETQFTQLLIAHGDLFEAFVKMPDKGAYAFPYSYKSSHTRKTHVTNENFNPDYFIRLKDAHRILVVEIKADEDRDRNRNAAKCRDGLRHFKTLNAKLEEMGEAWRYSFYFLSPTDYTHFFEAIRDKRFVDWKSGLMQELIPDAANTR